MDRRWPSLTPRYVAVSAASSGQVRLRHTGRSAESCFLPDLTRFAGFRCAGPDPQHRRTGPIKQRLGPRAGIQPPVRGLRVQGTTNSPPSTVRPAIVPPRRIIPTFEEGCESGRIGTPGERVWGNSPWVRIPLPPPATHRPPGGAAILGRRSLSIDRCCGSACHTCVLMSGLREPSVPR